MTSKLLVVSMILSMSLPAFAGDAPAAPAGDHATESKDAKKKADKKEEPKKPAEGETKKAEEKK